MKVAKPGGEELDNWDIEELKIVFQNINKLILLS